MVSCEISQKKYYMGSKKLTCERFTLNRKLVYLNHTCGRQMIIRPVQSELAFANPFLKNRKCPLCTRLTVLSKLMHIISTKFSNYFQIPGYLLHFIPIIIEIIIFRQVDNKRFNFIIKYVVHDTNFSSPLISIFSGYIFFTYFSINSTAFDGLLVSRRFK